MKKAILNTLKSVSVLLCVVMLTDCKKEPEAAPYSPPATNSPPIASFSYTPSTNLVAPVTVNFTNGSKNADSYVWTYDGSGNTLTTADISLVFNQAGTYTISLKATGKAGVDTYTKTITVTASTTSTTKPVADFTYSPSSNLVAPQKITFTSTSKNADSYKWDFGDGTTAAASSVTKEFTKAGDFVVKLTVTDARNQSDQKSVTISVKAATVSPVADYTWTASNLKATFTNISKNASSYAWNFGDGTTSTATNPTHDFSKAGTYTVNLKASDGKTEAQTTKLVTVSAPAAPTCDWNTYSTATALGIQTYFSVCGSVKDGLNIKITNKTSIKLECKFCLEHKDGTWDCGAATIKAGDYETYWSCKNTGKYIVWAMPADLYQKNNCPYPKP